MTWRGAFVLASAMAAMCSSGMAQGTVTVTGLKGQPYSLVEKTTQVRTLSDGTVVTTHSEVRRMQDSEGRTRTEMGTVKDGQFELQYVVVVDPVARTTATLSVRANTATVSHFPEPKPPTPEQEARMAAMRAKAQASRNEHPVLPPGFEDLEPETIAGMYSTGRRHTSTIPAGREGNDRDIHVVEDTWTSPDLRVKMRSMTDDPRIGKITMEVTKLERSEPDRALFQIPADYKVTEQTQ